MLTEFSPTEFSKKRRGSKVVLAEPPSSRSSDGAVAHDVLALPEMIAQNVRACWVVQPHAAA